MTTRWFRVHDDPSSSRVLGLFRRLQDEDGRSAGAEAYHPRHGWRPTDHWLRTARGEPDLHLVEVDEDQAWETMAEFDRRYAEGQP